MSQVSSINRVLRNLTNEKSGSNRSSTGPMTEQTSASNGTYKIMTHYRPGTAGGGPVSSAWASSCNGSTGGASTAAAAAFYPYNISPGSQYMAIAAAAAAQVAAENGLGSEKKIGSLGSVDGEESGLVVASEEARMQLKRKLQRNRTSFTPEQIEALEKREFIFGRTDCKTFN